MKNDKIKIVNEVDGLQCEAHFDEYYSGAIYSVFDKCEIGEEIGRKILDDIPDYDFEVDCIDIIYDYIDDYVNELMSDICDYTKEYINNNG